MISSRSGRICLTALTLAIVRLGLPGVFGCSAWTGRIFPLASER